MFRVRSFQQRVRPAGVLGPTTPILGGSSAADTYSYINAEASALVARMTVPPDDTRKGLIDALYTTLKVGPISGANFLNIMDNLYIMAAHNEQAGQLNWIANTHTLVPTGASLPTFSANHGYAGNGTSGYILWGTAAFNTGGKYQQNSGSLFAWEFANVSDGTIAIGCPTSGSFQFVHGGNAGSATGRLNDSTNLTGTSANSIGLTCINRSASNAKQLYKNGVSIGTSATVATSTNLSEPVCFLRNNTTYSPRSVAAGGKGNTMSANQNLDLYNMLNTYMTAVGA